MENQAMYCISYDLHKPEQNYDKLSEAIKSFGIWWHQTGSVWFVLSAKGAGEIRDFLMQYIDDDDKLFVVEVKRHWGGKGFSQKEYDWLNDNLK